MVLTNGEPGGVVHWLIRASCLLLGHRHSILIRLGGSLAVADIGIDLAVW